MVKNHWQLQYPHGNSICVRGSRAKAVDWPSVDLKQNFNFHALNILKCLDPRVFNYTPKMFNLGEC